MLLIYKYPLSKILFFLIVNACFLPHSKSQSLFNPKDSVFKSFSLTCSYYGEAIVHPGIRLGLEYQFWQKDKLKTKKNGKLVDVRNSFIWGGNISHYYHKRNHIGLLISADIGYRKVRKSGFKYEIYIGTGYLHTFLPNDTYRVNNSGNVEKIPLAGQSNFCPSISYGIGKDLSFKKGKKWSWHIKNHIFFQIPHNTSYLYHRSFEVGITYYLK